MNTTKIYKREDVIEIIDRLLQNPDVLIDAVTNEMTDHTAESLFESVDIKVDLANSEFAAYSFNLDCGRQGELTGTFIARKDHVNFLIENDMTVYFGEVLGKHSEVYSKVSDKNFEILVEDQSILDTLSEIQFGSGINPLEYEHFDFEYNGVTYEQDIIMDTIDKILQ